MRTYGNATGETLRGPVRMAALQNMCPKEEQTHTQLHACRPKCAQDAKAEVLKYVNAKQAIVGAGRPMGVDGAQKKRESAKREWSADDVGAAEQWGTHGNTHWGKGVGKWRSRWGDV